MSAAQIELAAQLDFERLGGLARHQVDRSAHRAGPVEHRGIALGDLDLGDVGRQEAAIVEPVVRGQIDADAVDRERHLEAVEAAHEEQSLVARPAAVAGRDAGNEAGRIVQRVAAEDLDGVLADRVAADGNAFARMAGDDDLAEAEAVVGRIGGGIRLILGLSLCRPGLAGYGGGGAQQSELHGISPFLSLLSR